MGTCEICGQIENDDSMVACDQCGRECCSDCQVDGTCQDCDQANHMREDTKADIEAMEEALDWGQLNGDTPPEDELEDLGD